MGIETTLTKASTIGHSLRTTVPVSIIRQFDLKEGDRLEWTLKVRGNRLVIEVEPKKREPR